MPQKEAEKKPDPERKPTVFPWWATVSTLEAGKTLHLPVAVWPGLKGTISATSRTGALAAEAHRAKRGKPRPTGRRNWLRSRNLPSSRSPLQLAARSIWLRPLTPSLPHGKQTLCLGLVVDHQALRAQAGILWRLPAKSWRLTWACLRSWPPPTGIPRQGEWMDKLQRWDQAFGMGISPAGSRNRLPVQTPRYQGPDATFGRILKTEVFRLVNDG